MHYEPSETLFTLSSWRPPILHQMVTEMWGDHQISDIRCVAHSTAALLDRVQCRPPPPLYGCTGDQPPGGEWTGTPPPPPLSTLLQRHSVGNRSWARPLVLSLQLRTQWSVIISKNRHTGTQQNIQRGAQPARQQRTERWRQCDPGRSGDHARVRGHPDIAWHHDTPRTL